MKKTTLTETETALAFTFVTELLNNNKKQYETILSETAIESLYGIYIKLLNSCLPSAVEEESVIDNFEKFKTNFKYYLK